MPFISSSEAKNAYFMSGEAMNEIYIFSLILSKNLNFLFILYNFKHDRMFALNEVIHDHTLRHINDDIA